MLPPTAECETRPVMGETVSTHADGLYYDNHI